MGAAGYILVMGVSGVGKSTVAKSIAQSLGGNFVEADDLHSPENVELMSAGIPLDDTHRWSWLDGVASTAKEKMAQGGFNVPVVIACSALKASYREFLRERLGNYFTVFLNGRQELILERMQARREHFMPPGLLDSQFAALEPPIGEPGVVEVNVSVSIKDVVDQSLHACRQIYGGDNAIAQ